MELINGKLNLSMGYIYWEGTPLYAKPGYEGRVHMCLSASAVHGNADEIMEEIMRCATRGWIDTEPYFENQCAYLGESCIKPASPDEKIPEISATPAWGSNFRLLKRKQIENLIKKINAIGVMKFFYFSCILVLFVIILVMQTINEERISTLDKRIGQTERYLELFEKIKGPKIDGVSTNMPEVQNETGVTGN